MWANDTNYIVIKNGVAVVSGTGPAIRVDGNKLVIRDGPQDVKPLVLTRAEASRRLRHVVLLARAGGNLTIPALRWLHDTNTAFSIIDFDGEIVLANGSHGTDKPDLRRAQAVTCSGAFPALSVAIVRELLVVKLRGQSMVARFIGAAEVADAIDDLITETARENKPKKLMVGEALGALAYWKAWEDLPVRFARANPPRLDHNGRWRPGRHEEWSRFGPRSSLLTNKPHRATRPSQAVLNFLYAILRAEMTIALYAAGLDPGIGLFHADGENRASLALDCMEPVRPFVDYWLLEYLNATAFANRDFTELRDGEVRLTHPLNAHLAHTAALWRRPCETVAAWIAAAFRRAAGAAPEMVPARQGQATIAAVTPLAKTMPVLPVLSAGSAPSTIARRVVGTAAPVATCCHECGRGLTVQQRKFCSPECAEKHRWATGRYRPIGRTRTRTSHEQHRATTMAGQDAFNALPAVSRGALRRWYRETLQPLLAGRRADDIAAAAAISRNYAYMIRDGSRAPHPRHYLCLAALAGIEIPKQFPAVISSPAPHPT